MVNHLTVLWKFALDATDCFAKADSSPDAVLDNLKDLFRSLDLASSLNWAERFIRAGFSIRSQLSSSSFFC